MKQISELQSFTIEEFQSNFDSLMDGVENGESFIITTEHGNFLISSYKEVMDTIKTSFSDEN